MALWSTPSQRTWRRQQQRVITLLLTPLTLHLRLLLLPQEAEAGALCHRAAERAPAALPAAQARARVATLRRPALAAVTMTTIELCCGLKMLHHQVLPEVPLEHPTRIRIKVARQKTSQHPHLSVAAGTMQLSDMSWRRLEANVLPTSSHLLQQLLQLGLRPNLQHHGRQQHQGAVPLRIPGQQLVQQRQSSHSTNKHGPAPSPQRHGQRPLLQPRPRLHPLLQPGPPPGALHQVLRPAPERGSSHGQAIRE
mmetsp:Transcript_39151/g.92116  ORF Transcript_39151/g.92116 Transcript_39151/m.92116 type:complete len:252 (-) Transcript_39151:556-1311(-)